MKKKYGLDSIIGKKSKLRFPDHITLAKTHSLYFTAPANDAISEPPLSTALTMKKGDPLEFCDQFNEETYEFEEGLPLNVIIYISVSSCLFEVKPPSTFSLLGIVFDLEDLSVEKFKASKKDVFLSAMNFGLIQLNPSEDFFLADLVSKVRSIYGSLSTYHYRRKYLKLTKRFLPKRRFKRYLLNSSRYQMIKPPQRYRLERYFRKTTKRNYKRLIPSKINQIHRYYDLLDLWDDLEDHVWEDPEIDLLSDLYAYIILSVTYMTMYINLENIKHHNYNILGSRILMDSLMKIDPSIDLHLELPFKLYNDQLVYKPKLAKTLTEFFVTGDLEEDDDY